MTTGDGGLSPSSLVVPAVDAPPSFFAVVIDDSATVTGTGTATATGDTGGHPGVPAGRRRHLELVRPKFEEKTPAVEADGKKLSPTSGVAEDAASSSGNGASGLKIRVAGRRPRTDTSDKGASSPRLALPWTATAVTSEAMPPASKRRKLVRPSLEGPVRFLRVSSKADASMAVDALKAGQDLKIAISEDLPLGEASDVAKAILPFYPRVLEGPDLLLLCNKIGEEAAVNSRLQINQSALAVLETQSRDLSLSIARDTAMLH
ncbi:unnamed protein product [Triticum turgidum subsp. durum]|uniref:Uncharacterized protein n=1 Tax=Triticum turgidum subsp. durum TaxID=4567 RepID=A0A9R1BL34_TRITD|nr:unnamed protein product [Triticum turgidum subsp. durum]